MFSESGRKSPSHRGASRRQLPMAAMGRALVLLLLSALVTARGQEPAAPAAAAAAPPPAGACRLSEFGPVGKPEEMKAAFDKAAAQMATTGGVLMLTPAEAKALRVENSTQHSYRIPPPPAPAKQWGTGPGFTIVEIGEKGTSIDLPQMNGLQINRTLRMAPDDSLPHWTTDHAVKIHNNLVQGSNSYLDWLAEPVTAGNDARFYVRTIRGIRPGQFLNAHGGPGYGGPLDRVYVKSVGYDSAKKLHYFVADALVDHRADAIVQNKNNVGLLFLEQNCNTDEQTYDVMLRRRQYAGGDTYMFFAWYDYMSDIHSAAGDENGTLYGAYTKSLANNFRAKVDRVNWQDNRLTFAAGHNPETLSNSRPLINLNRQKWVTAGKVRVVPAESYWDVVDTGKYPFEGKSRPTRVGKGGLEMGGLIRGDAACPWDASLIGRFFAVTEETETVPGGNNLYRWYEVGGIKVNADGTKDLTVRRFWWGVKDAASVTLYRLDNNTWDGHDRPLNYAIAPGTYVNDVGLAVPAGNFKTQPILGVAPYCDAGKPFDFAADDDIEQAIGPDPFRPVPFRMWMWDNVPGAWPAPVLDLANFGAAARYTALHVRGGVPSIARLPETRSQKPSWENVVIMEAAAEVGINCKADFTEAAILFQQPYEEQPIKWYYRPVPEQPPKAATLTVSKTTGELNFTGGARFGGSVSAAGLSGDAQPARNLRGKNVPVPAGSKELKVTFAAPEADADYAIFIEQTWLTNRAVADQTPQGFTVRFAEAAPADAKLHWLLVR